MDCVHHWKIETQNGAGSVGSCILCGESRKFRNSSPDYFDKFRGKPREKSLAKGTATSDRGYFLVGGAGQGLKVLAGSLFIEAAYIGDASRQVPPCRS